MSETMETSTITIVSSNPIRILHVDDDDAFLNMAKQCLELQTDIQVESAHSAKEALEKLKTKSFDVIVSDYQMAEKDGLEFLRELNASGNKIPFILFTGKGRDEVAVKALNLGAFRFMNKNGAPDAAYAELASCVRQARDHAKTQDMLKQSEKRFRAVFDSSIDAIVVVDDSGRIIYSNKAAQTMLNWGQDAISQALSEHFRQQFTATYERKMIEGFKEISENELSMAGKTLELTLQDASGEINTVELSFSAFSENGQWYGVSIIRDVTERKRQESLLKESQQKLMALFSQNPGALVFLDKDFRVADINHSFTALFGHKLEDIKGKIITDIIVPNGLEEETEIIREKIQEGPVGCSTIRKRNDGSLFNAALSGGPLAVNGTITGFFMDYMDISDFITVQEELSKALAKAELLNEKIVVLGGFTRHDVRNKLGLIQCSLYLARKKCNVNPDLEKHLQNIEEVIKNTTDILDLAKTYEMIGSEELVPTDVGKMVQSAVSLFSDQKGIEIDNRCSGFETLADSLLTQIFHNLIDNSLKYGTEKITKIKIYPEKSDDGSAKLIYEDDGIGIDESTKQHLFQKGFGKGTGFGLYLIRKICEVYGWSVQEKGQLGIGVKFEFTLPSKKHMVS
jgi:PAS domain S-box-containing protein